MHKLNLSQLKRSLKEFEKKTEIYLNEIQNNTREILEVTKKQVNVSAFFENNNKQIDFLQN